MAFDEILHRVGDSGRFQMVRIVLFTILSLLSPSHDILENFTAAIPDHHCSVNLPDNSRSEVNITMNLTTEALLKVSIPMGPNQKPEQCRRFRHTQWQFLDSNASVSNNTKLETEPCLDGWTYDHSVFTSTIVTEWDLVCDFQSFRYYAQATTMAGHLVASLLCGIVSDRLGRKPLLLYSCLVYGILGCCCAFAPNFFIYCVLRFLLSAFISNILINCPILVFEETSPQWHSRIIIISRLSSSIGQAWIGGLAYLLSDWHILILVYSLPHFVCFIVFCCEKILKGLATGYDSGIHGYIEGCLNPGMISIGSWGPESVRWLISTGKTEQAIKTLQRIALINGKKDIAYNLTSEALRSKLTEDGKSTSKHVRITDIIINPMMRKIVLCYSTVVFSATFSIFGILLDVRILGYNIFLNQVLLGVVDIPTTLLTYFIMRNVSRRPSIAFSILTLGGCFIASIFIPKEMHVLRLIVFLLGKGCIAVFICISLAYSQELSPTVLRSTLNSVYITSARIGTVISALVLSTRKHFVHLPMILYGIIPIVATISIYFLPETLNLPLVDSVKDLEKRLMNKSIHEKEEQDFLETTGC